MNYPQLREGLHLKFNVEHSYSHEHVHSTIIPNEALEMLIFKKKMLLKFIYSNNPVFV